MPKCPVLWGQLNNFYTNVKSQVAMGLLYNVMYNDVIFFHFQAEVVREEGEVPLLPARQQRPPQPLPLLPPLSLSRAHSPRR
jgi:hypothetical protein